MLIPELLSASPAHLDLIGEVDFHRSDVDGPGYTMGKYQARSGPGNGHMLPGQLALKQVGKAVCVCSSQRAVASATRPVGTGAGGQSGRPLLLWLVNLRSILLGRIHLLALPCQSGSTAEGYYRI